MKTDLVNSYHKLLQRQLKKYGADQFMHDEHFLRFIEAVNDSYQSFERDKELSEHAFLISEKDFEDMNHRLQDEVDLRKLSIQKLNHTLASIQSGNSEKVIADDNDLLEIVELLNHEISKRREAEKLLVMAKNEAVSASLAKSEFLSIMSHEIRTPLHAVIGMGHLLLKNHPRSDQVDNLKALKTSADNLLVLINDILDFNKIEAGKLEIEEAVFSIYKLLTDIVTANINNASERQTPITLRIDEKLPEYYLGDSLRIGQVLNNLISNAVKFTYNGKITVEILLKEIKDENTVITFSVQDTGIGIDKEKLAHIFLPFTQASTSTTRQFGGTGLGLAITKRILGLLHSTINVESTVNKGSRFYFDLSLQAVVGNKEKDYKKHTDDFDLNNKRILLVEDTPFNVLYAVQLLEGWKASVGVAENGEMAIQRCKEAQYDLILMDLQMPILDGYAATRQIREFNKTIPIIALTASADNNIREKVIAAGMQDYVTKPLYPDDFYTRIKKYID